MIPAWLILSIPQNIGKNYFEFNCKGTEVRIEGDLSVDGWILSVRVSIFGCTAYGYNKVQTNKKDSWKSVLLTILQQVINQHGSFVGGKKELVEQMRVVWSSP